jgi:hypothetical protein
MATVGKVISIRTVGQTVEMLGADQAVLHACRKTGARHMWNPRRKAGFQVHGDDAEAVMTSLERAGWRVDVMAL